MVSLALIALVGHAGQIARAEVTFAFEKADLFPAEELIPAGTLIHFTGTVGANTRRFILSINGDTVGDDNFRHRWNFDWDSNQAKGDLAHCEIRYAIPGESAVTYATFDIHILRKSPVSVVVKPNAEGGLNVTWQGDLPRSDCFADLLLDGTTSGKLAPGKVWEIPRRLASPGPHQIACKLRLPRGLSMESVTTPVDVPSPAWIKLDGGKAKWIVGSDSPEGLPSGIVQVQPGLKFTARHLFIDHTSLPVEGTANDLWWRVPVNLVHEGTVEVSAELVDAAGDPFTTPPAKFEVDYEPKFAAIKNTQQVASLVDAQFPTDFLLLSIVSGWRSKGAQEEIHVLRKGQVITVKAPAGDDEVLDTGNWDFLKKKALYELNNRNLTLSPSLPAERKLILTKILSDSGECLAQISAFADSQLSVGPYLPGDDPYEGRRLAEDRDTRILGSRDTLKALDHLFSEYWKDRASLPDTNSITMPELPSEAELLNRWTVRNLPRAAYLEWLGQLFADTQLGGPSDFPLSTKSRLSSVITRYSPSQLAHIANVLSQGSLVQHWDTRGFGTNEQGLKNSSGEELNQSRRLLGKAFGALAEASAITHHTNQPQANDQSKIQELLDQGFEFVTKSRNLAEQVRASL